MQEKYTIIIFGEAERGEYRTAYFCQNLAQLDEYFGHPPPSSHGLFYAVQALLFERHLIFFRVPEEGFSTTDYLTGLKLIERQIIIPEVHAICTPGVGDREVLDALMPICHQYHSILITNEADFYDYLTQK